jgi:hypothetical protein
MRLLYKPIALIAGLIAAKVGQATFKSLWARIDDAPPPKPGTGEGSMVKVVTGEALQAGVMAGVAAAVDRLFARGFHHIIGIWPKKPPKPEDDDS